MRKSTPVQYLIRAGIYCVGLFFMALAVAISVNSNLGVSPVNSLPYVINAITAKFGIFNNLGNMVTIVFCCYILLQIIILRKDFHPINLLQIVFSTIFGYFVNFAKWIVGDWAIPTYPGRLLMLAISIVLIAFGVMLYMEVQLVPMPMEGLSSTLAKKLGKPFPTLKTIVDCVVVGTGLVLSLVFFHGLNGIREGTIITALLTGKVIALMKKPMEPILQKLCFGEAAKAEK